MYFHTLLNKRACEIIDMLFAMPYKWLTMRRKKKKASEYDVRAVRDKLGLSRVQLAAKIGSSYESIGRWERGESISTPYRKLLEALQTDQR